MSADQRMTISVACEVHDAPRHLIVTRERDRLRLDLHADECCVIGLDRAAAMHLFKLLRNWLG